MRMACVECGHPTNKGLTVCIFCRTGQRRPERTCEDCGGSVGVRRARADPHRSRCLACRDRAEIERMRLVVGPILEQGGTLAEAGAALGLSRERVRQILAQHPGLAGLRRRPLQERVAERIGSLLESGELPEGAARKCGVSLATLRSLLGSRPDLRRLAELNRSCHRARRFDPIFLLVESEGLSLRAACGRLGIKCRMAIYAVARTSAAQARFPCLARVPSRNRIPALQVQAGKLDLPHAG